MILESTVLRIFFESPLASKFGLGSCIEENIGRDFCHLIVFYDLFLFLYLHFVFNHQRLYFVVFM